MSKRTFLLTICLLLSFPILTATAQDVAAFKYERGDAADAIWLTMQSLRGQFGFGLVDNSVNGIAPVGQLAIPYVDILRWPADLTAEQRYLTNHSSRTPAVDNRNFFFARFGGRTVQRGERSDEELIVLPTLAIDRMYLEFTDVPTSELIYDRKTATFPEFEHYDLVCREMHKWARRKGFLTAIPTGHQSRKNDRHFYGACLVKQDACDVVKLPGRAGLTDAANPDQIPLPDAGFLGWGSYLTSDKYQIQEWAKRHYSGRAAFLVSSPESFKFGDAEIAIFKDDATKQISVNHSILIVAGGPKFPAKASEAAQEWDNLQQPGALIISPYRQKQAWRKNDDNSADTVPATPALEAARKKLRIGFELDTSEKWEKG